MAQTPRPLRLFYSYSHEDEHLRDKLATALALLQRQCYLVGWHDRCIRPGAVWAGEIDAHLAAADIVLFLISPDFMASDYCYEIEMRTALQRHEQGLALVVPIVLRPTDWETSELGGLQCLPVNATPITAWDDEDAAFKNVVQGIRKLVAERQRTTPDGPDAARPGKRWPWQRWGTVALLGLAGLGLVAYAWWQSQTLALAGAAWLDIGEERRAVVALQRAVRWNPLNRRARDSARVAQVALVRHDAVQFRTELAALRTSMPEHPHVWLLVGDLAHHDNHAGDALRAYEAAFARRPSLSEAYFRAGVVLRQRGDIPAAAAAFAQAMQANPAAPDVPRYGNNLAFCWSKLGRLEEALALYGQSQQYPLSALEAARLLLARGALPQARDVVQRAVDWLRDPAIVALPQNQGPWEFDTLEEGIRLTEHGEKLCYAQMQLVVVTFLLGHESGARDLLTGTACGGAMADVREVVQGDLEVVRQANAHLAPAIEALRDRLFEPRQSVVP